MTRSQRLGLIVRGLRYVGFVCVPLVVTIVSASSLERGDAPPLIATLRVVMDDAGERVSRLEFGHPFLVDVTRTYPLHWSVDEGGDEAIDASGVDCWAELQDETRRSTSTSVEESRRYEVRVFATGTVRLSVASMSATSPTGEVVPFAIEPITIEVASSLASPAETIELPSDVIAAPPPRSIVWWVLPIVGVAVIVGMVFHRRRWNTPAPPPPAQIETPLSLATSTLSRIDQLRLEGEVEPLYSELAAIVRRYLASRFAQLPLPLTSEELVARYPLATEETPTELHADASADRVERLFLECDGVKFARAEPTIEQRRRAIAAAVAIVTLTSTEGPT